MLRDIQTNLVSLITSIFACRERLVHFIANLLPDLVAVRQPVIVAAGISRGGHKKKRFRIHELNRWTRRINQRWSFLLREGRSG